MNPREHTLLASVATDDLDVRFARFVQDHRARAVSIAWRLLGKDRGAAEDVAQDAFLKAYTALPRFRQDASFETWFYRILVRQASNHRRWRGVRERWSGLLGAWLGQESVTREPLSDPGLQQRIAQAIDGLSKQQREAFVLVRLEDFSVREAAEVMGCAPGTVKSHLYRAGENLQKALGDLVETSQGGTP